MSQKHVFYTFHIETNRLKRNYFSEKFLPFTTELGRRSLDKSDKLAFPRNSTSRQIGLEAARKMKITGFV